MQVLIVDDEMDTRQGLKDFIAWEELGVSHVHLASDGSEALEVSAKIKPDIIISDIRMPKMDGIAFVEKARKLLPASKIIMMSAYSEKSHLKSAIEFKAVNYVEKPINLGEMTAAVKAAAEMINKEREMLSAIRGSAEYAQRLAVRLTEQPCDIPAVSRDIENTNPAFLSRNRYCTLIVKTAMRPGSPGSRIHTELVQTALRDVFDDIFHAHLSARRDEGGFIVHACGKALVSEISLRRLLQKASSVINRNLGLDNGVFIAVGSIAAGLENIWKSYKTALRAHESFFFSGYGAISFYSGVPGPSAAALDEGCVGEFEEHLRNNDRAAAMDALENIMRFVRASRGIGADSVRNMYYKLATAVTAAGADRNLPDNENKSGDFTWKSIAEKETFQDICDYLKQKTASYFSSLEYISIRKPACRVIMYIEQNYAEKSLTINDIAQSIHLTPAYICNLFKKEMGVTINQHLNSYRIKMAKKLLKSPQLKLSDIAAQVGYADANYFMRIFKRTTALTPSEYPNKYLMQ